MWRLVAMDNITIISKVNEFLYQAAVGLAKWLDNMLPKVTDNWWIACVLDKLSENQRETCEVKGIVQLSELDLAALLRIADRNWYAMRNFAYLPTSERECIRDMLAVRNNWAHCGVVLPGKDSVIKNLHTILQFFIQIGVVEVQCNKLKDFIAEIEKRQFNSDTQKETSVVSIKADSNQAIKERDLVYIVANPTKMGMVFSVQNVGGTTKYEVFVDGELNIFYEGQIAPVAKEEIKWVDIGEFQSCMSAYQINNPSAANLYSLNAARIDFVPYQFRPALKMINADEPKILIADSVGVGKTIEAGLIIKELEARRDLERVMIICPKPLVSERKWELEMKRFDEDFIPLNGHELRQIISDTHRDAEWPIRYGKTIVPYSILDSRVYDGEDSKKKRGFGLKSLDPAPHFDLIIVDEAHHIRNGSLLMDKAYAYKCVKYFCDHADAVVFLTATPLQNSNDDLYTLLNLLRPDIIIDKDTFNIMARPNAFISKAVHFVRAAIDGWQEKALAELQNIPTTQWGENVISKKRIYAEIICRLQAPSLNREDRVKLITDMESLHSFNSMLNRTRRKDIQDFCVRRSHTIETEFTPQQRQLHDELLAFERAALSSLHDARSVPFMMSTIRRQASSCIFGLAPFIKDIIEKRLWQIADDSDWDFDDNPISDSVYSRLNALAQHVLSVAETLPDDDPKFDSVYRIVAEKQKTDNNKVMIFSTFRHTLTYVKRKLQEKGLRVAQVDGSVKDDQRCVLRERFQKDKSDPTALDILLFTEVGSEGLDYQFCDMMINYDLPWNPMRIEQRIGRIDRRGQVSEAVNIYNVITSDTVDADIYNRCLMRIGVFESSIGECEEILGEIGKEIEKVATDSTLTDDERRKKLEKIADNEVLKMQELARLEDEQKGLFGFDLSCYTLSKEVQEAESLWLTPRSIQFMVQRYLDDRLGTGNYIIGGSDGKQLRLSAPARALLREDFERLKKVPSALKSKWLHYLKGSEANLQITFVQEYAEKNRDVQFITTVHPLAKQAAKFFAAHKPVYVNIKASDVAEKGEYPFSVYAWNYIGLTSRLKLQVVCDNDKLADSWEDVLQSAVNVPPSKSYSKDFWDSLDVKHIALWQKAREEFIEDMKSRAIDRLETLRSSFENMKRNLEQKIADATDSKIELMFKSQLEAETEKYNLKYQEIEQKTQHADIRVSLIANGILTVE